MSQSITPTKVVCRLGDLGTNHVWFTSVGQPASCDLPGDGAVSGDGSEWWDLSGSLVDGRWEWDGVGTPRDFRGNTVTRIVAFQA